MDPETMVGQTLVRGLVTALPLLVLGHRCLVSGVGHWSATQYRGRMPIVPASFVLRANVMPRRSVGRGFQGGSQAGTMRMEMLRDGMCGMSVALLHLMANGPEEDWHLASYRANRNRGLHAGCSHAARDRDRGVAAETNQAPKPFT